MNFTFVASYIALWALVVFQGLVALALLQQLADLRKVAGDMPIRDRSLPIGSRAPVFDGRDHRNERIISSQAIAERGAVLVFLSSCPTCIHLAEDLQSSSAADLPPIILFYTGGEASYGTIVEKLPSSIAVLLRDADTIAKRYQISSSPTAVVLDSNKIIRGSGHPSSLAELKRLVNDSLPLRSRELVAREALYPAVTN